MHEICGGCASKGSGELYLLIVSKLRLYVLCVLTVIAEAVIPHYHCIHTARALPAHSRSGSQ